ncbi:SWI/SNF chromatin-remodeling complex subunit [Steccherinum ochraceum]|uniref:SWI/SNF chromatin-remodeling complex subunit n=1 Tax=Steccherinum ochraceum TaxID=92696 RepID=A0A4R0RKP7_9APHY|nr:SWI/SNF chromatin-remodeling complex subunit [Steccherinum ochraceum]
MTSRASTFSPRVVQFSAPLVYSDFTDVHHPQVIAEYNVRVLSAIITNQYSVQSDQTQLLDVVRTSRMSAPRPTPRWLEEAMHALQAKHPDDRYQVVCRTSVVPALSTPWRIKCLDCPSKLYQVGPGETLNNFEIHVRNRYHRAQVDNRVASLPKPPLSRL